MPTDRFTPSINFRNLLDNDQRLSISLIRSAVGKIWSAESPRVIKDFTDHGLNHCDRVEYYASEILLANEGRPLSKEEVYSLLCGIYLHDIGMQCDIIKYPEIKEIAESEFKAKFNIKFTSPYSGNFNIEEQNSIRENHNLLSAAWIRFARQSRDNPLGLEISTIPAHLINDIINICMFHSKLPISDCDLFSLYNSDFRKQLIAALLRFSDELDIDANHVLESTIENFRLPPQNALYWWIHNRINIQIQSKNSITIKIGLNPDDIRAFGPIIYNAFILAFQRKNRQVLSILKQNNLNIFINNDSDIVSDKDRPKIPQYIIQQINAIVESQEQDYSNIKKNIIPSIVLANEISKWLTAINFEVDEPRLVSDSISEMDAIINKGFIRQKYIIQCIEGEIEKEHVENLYKRLKNPSQGIIISDQRVSEASREITEKIESIRVFNFSNFLDQMIWRPYFISLRSIVNNSKIIDYFEDLKCFKRYFEEGGWKNSKETSLCDFVDKWLKERGSNHLSILGGFGSGKTWFCRYYAHRQLERYLENPINERLPLLITLREYSKALSVNQLINDAFFEKYQLDFIGSAVDIFKDLNKQGKLLLILDGFDEMAQKVDYQTIVSNFWELGELIEGNSKIILTCRTEHFRWDTDVMQVLYGKENEKTSIILPKNKFEVIYLNSLDDAQVSKIIYKRLVNIEKEGERLANRIIKYIEKEPDFKEMARRPVFIELILAALNELKIFESISDLDENKDDDDDDDNDEDITFTTADVYFYATNNLILKNIKEGRTFTSTEDKLLFLAELAWDMMKKNKWSLNYKEFPRLISNHFGSKIEDTNHIDFWERDLRSQAMLIRDSYGNYEFAHRSLAEFFISIKFAAELGCLDDIYQTVYIDLDKKSAKLPFKQLEMEKLADTFGYFSLRSLNMKNIRLFICELIGKYSPIRLWSLIDEASMHKTIDAKFCGGNAATILQDLKIWYYREDIQLLLDQIQKRPELVFPLRMPKIDKIRSLLDSIESNANHSESKELKQIQIAYGKIINYLVTRNKKMLDDASNQAALVLENQELKEIALAIEAYIGLQYLYESEYTKSEKHFNKFEMMGGKQWWSKLKRSLLLLQNGEIKTAKDLTDSVLKVENILSQKDIFARANLMKGIEERLDENYAIAVDHFQKAIKIFELLGDKYHYGTSLANLGMTYRMMGDYSKAIEYYENAKIIFKGDKYLLACLDGRIGTSYRLSGDFKKSIEYYNGAAEDFISFKDSIREGMVRCELGTTFLIMGMWSDAISNYEKATQLFSDEKLLNNPTAVIRLGLAVYSIGLAFLMQGYWKDAITRFTDAIDKFNFRDNYLNSLFYSSIGIAYRMLDNPNGARNYLSKSLKLVEELEDYNRQSLILLKLGNIYRYLREYDKALSLYQQSLKIIKRLKKDSTKISLLELSIREADVLGNIGIVYRMQNKIKKSITYFNKSLNIFENIQASKKIGWILGELGQVYLMQGLIDEAINRYKQALTSILSKNEQLIDESLVRLAEGYIMQGYFKGGIQKFTASLNEIQRLGDLSLHCKILSNLGEAYRLQGHTAESLDLFYESLEISRDIKDMDQVGLNLCYISLAHADFVYSNTRRKNEVSNEMRMIIFEQYSKANSNILNSIKIFRDLDNKFLLGWALENKGKICFMQELWDDAIKCYKEAASLNYSSIKSHLYLSSSYKKIGNIDYSEREWEKAKAKLEKVQSSEYDLACLEAIHNNFDVSMNYLYTALQKGLTNQISIEKDPLLFGVCNYDKYMKEWKKQTQELQSIEIIPFM